MKRISMMARSVLAVAAVVVLSACADGGHIDTPKAFMPAIAKPEIVMFQISKVGGAEEPSGAVAVSKGDSVLLEWEVASAAGASPEGGSLAPKSAKLGADEKPAEGATEDAGAGTNEGAPSGLAITLDSEALGLHLAGLPAVGSHTVEDIDADAVFVLTAKEASGSDSRDVSVTIVANELDVTFTAAPSEIKLGETAELCWTISRADAVYTVIADDGSTLASSEDETTLTPGDEIVATGSAAVVGEETEDGGDTDEDTDSGEEAEEVEPAVGISRCVTVAPEKTTTYYLTVTADGVADVRKEAVVTLAEVLRIDSFTASPQSVSGAGRVTLNWSVTPEQAVVAITGVEGTFGAVGSVEVDVVQTTAFELTAKLPGCETAGCAVSKSLTVEASSYQGAYKLDVSGGKVIFAGESAEITWSVTDDRGVGIPGASVTISGGEFGAGSAQPASGSITVSPTATVEYTLQAVVAGLAPAAPAKVKIAVRSWAGPQAGDVSTERVMAVSAGTSDTGYAGFGGKLLGGDENLGEKYLQFASGTADGSAWSAVKVPFMKAFTSGSGIGGMLNYEYLNQLEYPVNAIAADSSKIYAGTTGGVIFSRDGGANWAVLVRALYGNDPAYSGSHPSCKGAVAAGWKDVEINALEQVCDIAIASDGRFFAATDKMLIYLPKGVDAYITEYDGDGNPSKFTEDEGAKWHGLENASTRGVNHDIDIGTADGRDVLFVGTARGVIVTLDMGGSYSSVGGEGAPSGDVYSVRFDPATGTLYAGGRDGNVYSCGFSGGACAGWTSSSIGSAPVYSITLDPVKAGAVFAATGGGVYYSEDGRSWRDVSVGAMTAGIDARSIASAKNAEGTKGTIYVGTSAGVFTTSSDVVDSGTSTAPTRLEELPPVGAANANAGIL